MRARRMQLYWFPLGTTVAVVGGWALSDPPETGALVRNATYGFRIGRFDTASFLTWSVAILAAAWTVQALTDRPRKPSPWSHHVYYVTFGVLYADLLFLAAAHGRTAAAAGAPLWAFAGLVPVAWLGRHVAAKLEEARARAEGEWDAGPPRRPVLRLGRTEAALWVGRNKAPGYRVSLWAGTVAYALIVLLAFHTHGVLSLADAPPLAFATAMLVYGYLTTSVEVTVGEGAVCIAGGPFRVPLCTIPFDDVVEARVEDVRPRHYGGYGYHAKGGRRCLIVRAGDALVLRRRSARDMLVTVDGAAEGAALVNALVARATHDSSVATR